MKEEEILAILRLQKTKSIGDILAKKLIATVGNAFDVFNEKKTVLDKIHGIGSYAIKNLLDDSHQELAEKEPDRYQVGSVYTTVRFTSENPIPKTIWEPWLAESYQLSC